MCIWVSPFPSGVPCRAASPATSNGSNVDVASNASSERNDKTSSVKRGVIEEVSPPNPGGPLFEHLSCAGKLTVRLLDRFTPPL